MSIRMFKSIFCNIDDLNKLINKNIVLHAYINSHTPLMDICHIATMIKGTEYQCNFFVVPGNGQALLRMPDCEQLKLLTANCLTINWKQTNLLQVQA